MATDGDYTSDDYLNGFLASKDHVGGAGDFFEVEGPKSRFALNIIIHTWGYNKVQIARDDCRNN